MTSMIPTLVRLASVVVTVTVCLTAAPAGAQDFYVSATGSGTACSLSQPCSNPSTVLSQALAAAQGRIICLTPIDLTNANNVVGVDEDNTTFEMDCPNGTYMEGIFWGPGTSNNTAKFRNVIFTNLLDAYAIHFGASGTLIFENCVFENSSGNLLEIEPSGPLNLVIRNSRISNGGSGILLKPAAGGSINATFDHVTVAANNGGGIHADSSNGPVTVDISDSTISENVANGFNVTSGTGTQNDLVSIARTTIAKNGIVGIQTGGSNAAVMLDATLLDSNVSGATTVVNGGRILSYGNNRIVGSAGSGFTGSAGLQ